MKSEGLMIRFRVTGSTGHVEYSIPITSAFALIVSMVQYVSVRARTEAEACIRQLLVVGMPSCHGTVSVT